MKVKVCGITNLDDAYSAVSNGADAIGFIFYSGSKRYIDPVIAKEIIDSLPFFIMKVGVFVNEECNSVNGIAKNIGLNAVQLHGDEDQEYVDKIRYPVIKAIRVGDEFHPAVLDRYENVTLLLDTYTKNEYGGSGKKFDWGIIPKPIMDRAILAGGVSEENIEFIYNNIKPQAVDLSSSLELSPGKKDHSKINSFFKKLNKLRNKNHGSSNGH